MRTALFVLCAVALNAASERNPELPAAIRPLVDLARSAPPEFFADTILRLVQSGRIPQRELQIDLLTDAFTAAAGAREPLPLVAIPVVAPDTRALYRGKAGALKLDALSLQSRIVGEMLTLDRGKAHELFNRIPRPALDPRPCEDPLVADASAYYDTAAAIAQSAFSSAEKEKEVHVQFLATELSGARSPNELAAFARSLQGVELTAAQRELLLSEIAGKLTNLSADYRSFALFFDTLESELGNQMEIARAAGSNVDGVRQAFRKYMVNQLNAARCGPNFFMGTEGSGWWSDPPLGDLKNPTMNDSFKADPYFQSDDAKQIGDALRALGTAADRRSASTDFLHQVSLWNPAGTDADVLHQQATVYRALLELTPAGEDRDRLIKLAAGFLEHAAAERSNPAEWLWETRELVDKAGPDAGKLIASFRVSSSASLQLYFGSGSGTSK